MKIEKKGAENQDKLEAIVAGRGQNVACGNMSGNACLRKTHRESQGQLVFVGKKGKKKKNEVVRHDRSTPTLVLFSCWYTSHIHTHRVLFLQAMPLCRFFFLLFLPTVVGWYAAYS